MRLTKSAVNRHIIVGLLTVKFTLQKAIEKSRISANN